MFALIIYNHTGHRAFTMYTESEWLIHDIAVTRKMLQTGDCLQIQGVL